MTRIGDRRTSDGIVKTVMPVWAIRTIRMNKVYQYGWFKVESSFVQLSNLKHLLYSDSRDKCICDGDSGSRIIRTDDDIEIPP